jgi:sulfotransferase family protein
VKTELIEEDPFFVVGCPRSGTTLVRSMLREHPRLVIPPEAPWLTELAPRRGAWSRERRTKVLDQILGHPRYRDWSLPAKTVRAAVEEQQPSSYSELVRVLFAVYALREAKPRWGDKTPENVLQVDLLARLFPAAVFIHVIRDGREVAASLADQPWTTDGLVGKAYFWCDCVTAGRRAGRRLGSARYCEVRLEDLVADPEHVLARVCAAIGESYTPRMLEYPSRGAEMDRRPEFLRWSHRHLAKPPTAGLRDWEEGVPADERAAVRRICRPLLTELGYEPG